MTSLGQCSRSSDSGRKLSSIGSESALESRSGEEIFSTEEGATSNLDRKHSSKTCMRFLSFAGEDPVA
jgi:hypothetical protein